MKNELEIIAGNKEEFIRFLKSKYSLFHLSNVFFRDLQYGIISFEESKGAQIPYGRAEEVAKLVIQNFEQSGILKLIKPGSWMLNYPEFRKPSVKPSPSTSTPKPNPATQTGAGAQPAVTAATAAVGSTSVANG
jgi:hypothetical protein